MSKNSIQYTAIFFIASSFILGCKHRDTSDAEEKLAANRANEINLEAKKYVPVEEIFSFKLDEDALALIGEWEAVSNNHIAICGDMIVDTAVIAFEKKDSVSFQVWHKTDEEWILKISKDVDDGIFMRIGPVAGVNSYRSQMEVAYYKTQEDAMATRYFPAEHASSWGIYTRKRN